MESLDVVKRRCSGLKCNMIRLEATSTRTQQSDSCLLVIYLRGWSCHWWLFQRLSILTELNCTAVRVHTVLPITACSNTQSLPGVKKAFSSTH